MGPTPPDDPSDAPPEPHLTDYAVPESDQARVQTVDQMLRFVERVCEAEVLGDLWADLSERERRKYRVAVLKRYLDISYRRLEERLATWPIIAERVGLSGRPPDYTTLSRWVTDVDDDLLDELLRRAEHAVSQFVLDGTPVSRIPLDPTPTPLPREFNPVSMDEKMAAAEKLTRGYLDRITPYIGFGRDSTASNYQHSTASFFALLAHIALEDCFLENGAEVLEWQGVCESVPSPETLRKYARQFSVREVERRFAKATYALLDRPGLAPTGPTHLAFDVTDVTWYGDTHRWTGGREASNNSASAWQYAILSVANADRKYVLSVGLMQKRTHISDALRRQLRLFSELGDLTPGRAYFDREMYQREVVATCREVGVDFMIQAKNIGDIKRLREEAQPGRVDYQTAVQFAGLPRRNRPNAFVSPIHPKEEAAADREWAHEAWLTDLDVAERDLIGLSYQFRTRWRVETAIRQMKTDFMGRCASADRRVRALYFGAAQLFYNIWVALNRALPNVLGDDVSLTATETLHAIRRAG